jgi:hypothetical protein
MADEVLKLASPLMEVKNKWMFTSIIPCVSMHRDIFVPDIPIGANSE